MEGAPKHLSDEALKKIGKQVASAIDTYDQKLEHIARANYGIVDYDYESNNDGSFVDLVRGIVENAGDENESEVTD